MTLPGAVWRLLALLPLPCMCLRAASNIEDCDEGSGTTAVVDPHRRGGGGAAGVVGAPFAEFDSFNVVDEDDDVVARRRLGVPTSAGAANTEKRSYVPSFASYADADSPDTDFSRSSYVKVDGPPGEIVSYLHFTGLPVLSPPPDPNAFDAEGRDDGNGNVKKVVKAELVLKCANASPTGGIVHKGRTSAAAAKDGALTWNTRPIERYPIFARLATVGPVQKGETYTIDISRVIKRGDKVDSDLNLVILPAGGNDASYSKRDVRLIVTVELHPPPPTPPKVGPFQIMLYHDAGTYLWQGKPDRRSWCADCKDTGWRRDKTLCRKGDYVQVNECDENNVRQWWYYEGGRFRAASSGNDDDLCWDYRYREYGPHYKLEPCDTDGSGGGTQTFVGGGPNDWSGRPRNKDSTRQQVHVHADSFNTEGNFEQSRFELYPVHQKKRRYQKCVTQDHHPKRGEYLKSQDCRKARRHDTSYWVATAPPMWSGHALDK